MVRNILLTLVVIFLNACGVSSALQQLEVATAASALQPTTVTVTRPATVRVDPAARARIQAAEQNVAAAQVQVHQAERAALTADQLDAEAAALDARLGTILSDAQQPQGATVNGGVAASDLPRTDVKPFPVWFVGLDSLTSGPQAIVCVGRNAYEARIENMTPAMSAMWCRRWSAQLSNDGSQPIDHREERPGTGNGRNQDIFIPLTPDWSQAVVTLYGRVRGRSTWGYINQRLITEDDPGASINALDLDSGERHPLSPSMGLPRAVATRHGHHGRHRRHARR
ncbi:hypothetical protein KBD61_02240 [Patescibacteria group bacterium]|nr:hypothetical protein [Patescibacteria group bacterium]